jgi:hypothetical protein
MIRRSLFLYCLFLLASAGIAQKAKLSAAWRSLSDYEEGVKEGKPNPEFLQKAKDNVDEAAANEKTATLTRTQTYRARIYYALYRQNLEKEMKNLEATVGDKNERLSKAYGNTGLSEFETATAAIDSIRRHDSRYFEKITEGLKNGNASLDDDALKFALVTQQMKLESGNIASGKYGAKQYDKAADYFYKTAVINTVLYNSKDTANFYNACVAAGKAKDQERIKTYNRAMIDAGVPMPYNYESLYNVQIAAGDSAGAVETLKRGRAMFPADGTLLTQETNLFLATNRRQEALNNLKISSERDPNNALYYFVMGNIYDNLANPKNKETGKDLDKPANFEESFQLAEQNYQKAIDLNPSNQEYLYNALYNLGAMYNNYGGYIAARGGANAGAQKANDVKAQEYYKKAIPYLERALALRRDDKSTMAALRKLYLLTRDDAKAKQMSDRLKAAE